MHSIDRRTRQSNDLEIGFGSCVEDEAKIGDRVKIGHFTHIFPGVVIAGNCVIGDHCIIGHPSKLQLQKKDFSATSPKVREFIVEDPITRIGERSIIRSGSIIYTHAVVGRKLRTGHDVVIREHVTLGNDCVIGTHAVLDGYIKVGNKSMIQSQCYIAQSVKIGDGVFVSPGCVFLDNKKMILGEGLNGAVLGNYVRVGGGAKILPGVTIGEYALIGAGAVVTKNVPSKAIAYGAPAVVRGLQSDREIENYVDSIMRWE